MAGQYRRQIFLSHNSDDEELIRIINDTISHMEYKKYSADFENVGDQVLEEYEPASAILRDEIANSEAVLFAMSAGAPKHTLAWVAWELGVAAQARPPVVVLEEVDNEYNIPIPYLDDYVLFDKENDDVSELRDILEDIIDRPGSDAIRHSIPCTTPYDAEQDGCQQEYGIWLRAQEQQFKCPSCRIIMHER